MVKIMTAGPTQVRENVRAAIAREATNPDLDPEFCEFYHETCRLLSKALNTDNEALILGGEGILGLEAACASLTEPGDRVLVIDNGIFGKGFADFVSMYGGEPVLLTLDYHRPASPEAIREYLEKDHNFKYATFVHCDTPSGVLNDVEEISKIMDSYGILSVVDSVAGMFGEPLNVGNSKIDILCGGSQKALSAPPGLTMLWVSDRAWKAMEDRKTPIASFYANIMSFRTYYQDQWFPYTMPINDIVGLRQALDNFIEDTTIYERHAKVAEATRAAITEAGLTLYLDEGDSNTVTVLNVPDGITDKELLGDLKHKHNIMISGCFDVLAGKVVRIGHMGENCYPEKVEEVLEAMQEVLENHRIELKANMKDVFRREYGE